ncbi:type II DNA modification enzyme, partial [Pseudanabaenaceae cyanobacterium LEGE 13415]|nr:type II DNA modification enzyme [Pseudanabaenaceae cyanobacterium LEGE 13415]
MLPGDLLQRIVIGDKNLDGLSPASYHLLEGEKLNEAINRSWNRLRGAWVSFQAALKKLPEHDLGTSVTRDRFLLPLFQELGYGRLAVTRAVEIEGKNYPISHRYQHTPIHLVGWGVNLDKRTAGAMGAARSSPHSLVQEFLNRSDSHLWAFVSNGRKLRILRDNISLTRQSFVEFDLEAMMSGEVYADFVVLWLLCHQSRVESEVPKQCWLERWSQAAQEQGTRALEQLRDGVEAAITALGQGFLSHPHNRELRQLLQTGELTVQNYYHQLRRLVYRLLFLFVVEDRDALLDPTASLAAKERYTKYYSTTRLRSLADRTRGTRHSDLFHSLRVVVKSLGGQGCPELGLPALGSFLWSEEAIAALESCQIANFALLDAVRSLAFITD